MTIDASVVVASNRSPELVEACLSSLDEQCRARNAELLLVRAGEPASVESSIAARPHARVIAAPRDASIPVLRGYGLSEAAGRVVALTEDHCVVGPGWLDALAHGIRAGSDVVGGGMGNARTDRSVDWAAYFSEYGFFSSTRVTDAASCPALTGANVAYGPGVLARVAEWARAGEWEDVIHERLRRSGARLDFDPEARVLQNRSYGVVSFCGDRYEHGRAYARVRLREDESARRWLRFASAPFLPVLLGARVARAAGRDNVGAFVRALPFTLLFLAAWAAGEMVGYGLGPAPAVARWRGPASPEGPR